MNYQLNIKDESQKRESVLVALKRLLPLIEGERRTIVIAFCAVNRDAATCFIPHRADKWHADLYGLARQRLLGSGVTQISGGGFCTVTESARFFSYRRERESGRMAAAIWLAPT